MTWACSKDMQRASNVMQLYGLHVSLHLLLGS
jgi:hypothetical protein